MSSTYSCKLIKHQFNDEEDDDDDDADDECFLRFDRMTMSLGDDVCELVMSDNGRRSR